MWIPISEETHYARPHWLSRMLWPSRWLSARLKQELAPYRSVLAREIELRRSPALAHDLVGPFLAPVLFLGLCGGAFSVLRLKVLGGGFGSGQLTAFATACAGAVAALAGILIAVLVLALRIHCPSLPGGAALLPVFALRHGYVWTLGLSLGTVASSLSALLLAPSRDAAFLNGCAMALSIESLVSLTALMALAYKGIAEARSLAARELLELELQSQLALSLIEAVRSSIADHVLQQEAEKLGLRFLPFHRADTGIETEYSLANDGWVADVDLRALADIAPLLIARHPGSVPVLAATWAREVSEEASRVAFTAAGSRVDDELAARVQHVFIVRTRQRRQRSGGWQDIHRMLKALLLQRDSIGLQDAFRAFEAVVRKYLQVLRRLEDLPDAAKTLAYAAPGYRPPGLESIAFSSLVESAVADSDRSCLEEVSMFLERLGDVALEFGTADYFRDALVQLARLYRVGAQWQGLGRDVRQIVPERFRSISELVLGMGVVRAGRSSQALEKVEPFVRSFVACGLATARAAGETGDAEGWDAMLDYINSAIEMAIRLDPRPQFEMASRTLQLYRGASLSHAQFAQQQMAVEFLHASLRVRDWGKLATWAAGAWVAHLVSGSKMGQDRAKPLLETAMSRLGSLVNLVESYLFRQAENEPLDGADTALGYAGWELKAPVTGRIYVGWGTKPDEWMLRFWVCVALKRAAADHSPLDPARVRPLHAFRKRDFDGLQGVLKDVLGSWQRYGWFLEGVDLSCAEKALTQSLQGLLDWGERKWVRDIAEAQLSPARIVPFKDACLRGYANERRIANLIRRAAAGCVREPMYCSTLRPSFGPWIEDKALFVDLPLGGSLAGESIGEGLAQWETVIHASWAESQPVQKGAIVSLAAIQELIRTASADLKKEGFAPDAVFVPQDDRFHRVLTNVPEGERKPPEHMALCPEWVCEFEGMAVFAWPHADARSVSIMDVAAFLAIGDITHDSGSLMFSFETPSLQEIEQWLGEPVRDPGEHERRLRDLELCGNDKDLLRKTRLKMKVSADVNIAVVQRAAGVKLKIDAEAVGYVYADGGASFHSPDCAEVNAIPKDKRRYCETREIAWQVKGLTPCDKCNAWRSAFL
ncbi:MAG: hypothetical protein Q8Q12_04680 [bacterium]|nr:hypothetical protein [bacterium]